MSVLTNLTVLRDRVLVDPVYDAEKVYGLHIPETGRNPMSQQGPVVAVGSYILDIQVGDYLLYHPWVGLPFRWQDKEYLAIQLRHIAGFLSLDGEVFPLPDHVLIKPEFSSARPDKSYSGLIWLPSQQDNTNPPTFGSILRCGDRVSQVRPGQRVAYENEGNEIGVRKGLGQSQVVYTIHQDSIAAIIEDTACLK